MILIQITEDEIRFSAKNAVRTSAIRKDNHPGIFRHPRLMVTDPKAAAAVITPELKSFTSWKSPKVEIEIRQKLLGGLTEVDKRVLREAFLLAGARDARISEPQQSGNGTT